MSKFRRKGQIENPKIQTQSGMVRSEVTFEGRANWMMVMGRRIDRRAQGWRGLDSKGLDLESCGGRVFSLSTRSTNF